MKDNNAIDIFLDGICDKIKYKPIRNEIRTELYDHIIEDKNNYMNEGLNNNDAELQALKNIGDVKKISNDFNNIYKRKLDWKLLIILVLLIGVNILLYATVFTKNNGNTTYIIMNSFYLIIGIIISISLYFIDYRKINNLYIRYRCFRIIF